MEQFFEFPQYRKYPNGRAFFKILSPGKFIEVKLIGKESYSVYEIEARILPERNYIADLLSNEQGYWQTSNAKEFDEVLNQCQAKLRLID